jgi:predicted TPR repeat methyltransferase
MRPEEGFLEQAESDPEAILGLYDDWASGYDDDIKTWGYNAPQVTAAYLRGLVSNEVPVLDAGCGTGLVGKALQSAGFDNVVGIDFSVDSLTIAKATGAYRSVEQIDLTRLPTDLATARFGALVCIGVMSYLPDIEATCREFCRLVTSGSPIVLTQRGDLFQSRGSQSAFDALVNDGTWEQLEVTSNRDYLETNPEFTGIGVRYCMFRRC